MIVKKHYCAGFLFDIRSQYVMLIQKTKPAWQAGSLNGVGGKVEPGEDSYEAMVREFKEETNLEFTDWRLFCDLNFAEAKVDFFKGFTSKQYMESFTNMTEEPLSVWDIRTLMSLKPKMIPNLKWLIPMALSFDEGERAESFTIHENYTEAGS